MVQIIDRFRSSTWGWLRGTLAGWATILLAIAGPVGAVLAGGNVIAVTPLAPLGLTLVALTIIAWKWIANLATTFEVTDDRLILHKGVFVKSIDEVELYRVKNVRVDFTLINQWADIGTIGIVSSDETTHGAPLMLRDVEHARARREKLRMLVNAARVSRGVREIDMVHENI